MNLADLAYADFKKKEELERQRRVVIARDMYEGDIDGSLLSQLDDALPGSTERMTALFNAYATVIEEVLNRLQIVGWQDAPTAGQPVEWAENAWQDLDMDELQYDLFEYTLVDGEALIILAPGKHSVTDEPVILPYIHRRWTSAEAGGDNEGFKAHYVNGRLAMVSKRWIEEYYNEKGEAKTRQRMTLYVTATDTEPSRVEKYEILAGVPVAFAADGEAVVPWPHAFACIHFRNVGHRQQGQRAQGPQILLDNLFADLGTAASSHASPMLSVIGGYPTTDGKAPNSEGTNIWKTGPGQIIGFPNKNKSEAEINHVPPGDLSQLLDSIDKTTVMLALTTGTTGLIANLNSGSQISGEFLKQTDIRPTAATRQRQTSFGNAMVRMMQTYARLTNDLIPGKTLPTDTVLHAQWMAADIRGFHPGDGDEAAEAAAAANQPAEA